MNVYTEQLSVRENSRCGLINYIYYSEMKKMPKQDVYRLQEIELKGNNQPSRNFLLYVHDYHPQNVTVETNNNICYNPRVAKFCLVTVVKVIISVIVVSITFS